jgi:hypothetical protein
VTANAPRDVVAGELDGSLDDRLAHANGIVAALTEAGYAIVPVALLTERDRLAERMQRLEDRMAGWSARSQLRMLRVLDGGGS